MNKIFAPFLPPWVETGLQPAFYDVESGTVLQQTARMYAKVQQLTRLFNELSEETKTTVEEYIAKFVELKNFVDNYFDNLDVQEEVNNKLDAMVEDGTLQTLLSNYLVICGGNAKELGCAGDGVTDDTTALQDAITQLSALGINKLVIPSGEFVVTNTINLPSDFVLEGMEGSVIKYTGEGKSGSILRFSGEYGNYKSNITIRNLTIDATGQQYKGGASDATPLLTSTSPKYKGIVGISGNYATEVLIDGCNLIDIYGDGIKFTHSANIKIVNNNLSDCSGGNIRSGGDSGYDNFGDGIVCLGSWNCLIDGNTIVNKRTYLASSVNTDIGKPCGRSGTEYEYGLDMDSQYSPYYDLFVGDEAKGLVVTNNFIYGYTKGGHFETDVEIQFDSNTVVNNHIGVILSVDGNSSVTNNLFDDNNVGKAPQSGYDDYHGAIALTTYGNLENGKFVIDGNIIIGRSGKGVTVGKQRAIINSNTFYNADILNIVSSSNDAIITDNNFYDSRIILFQTSGWIIENNAFNNATKLATKIEGCTDISIKSNIINNSIETVSTCNNITIEGNNFKTNADFTPLSNNSLIDTYGGKDIKVLNNSFYLSGNASAKSINISGQATGFLLNGNSFYGSTSISNASITCSVQLNDVSIKDNRLYGFADGYKLFTHGWIIKTFVIENNVSDNKFVYLYYQTGGTAQGLCKASQNTCGIKYASTPNDTLSRFKNLFMNYGDVIRKFDGTSSWKVTRSGIYATDNYADGAVTVGKYVISNTDYVYKAQTAGTASVAPTGTTTGGTETGTDGITWICCGKVATITTA